MHTRFTPPRKNAFSLVELSIVLVILGLLVGGILSGQALIRAAELRAVAGEYTRYAAAVNTFRDKYFQVPGDMANATSFWGIAGGATGNDGTCRAVSSADATTCNGNGNGSAESASAGSFELFRFWQHLSNAGLIEGRYTGSNPSNLQWGSLIGVNTPASKIANAGWSVVSRFQYETTGGWYVNMFPPSSGAHWFMLGTIYTNNSLTLNPLIKPEEAWNLDSKLDDGLPGTGRITTLIPASNPNCASSATAASATYMLTQTGINCTMLMGF